MMLKEMRERDECEATMTRNAVISAEKGDQKRMGEVVRKARAERGMGDQVPISRRVAREVGGRYHIGTDDRQVRGEVNKTKGLTINGRGKL